MLYSVTVSEKGQITIPSKIRKALHIEYGQEVILMKKGQSVDLLPIPKRKVKQSILHLFGSVKSPKGNKIEVSTAREQMRKIRYGKNSFS